MKNQNQFLKNYLEELNLTETEHTNRLAFQKLLEKLANDLNLKIIHEPKRDVSGFGSPDFRIEDKKTKSLIGYIETKRIDENLSKIIKDEQIQKYQKLSENLILTDYLDFIWLFKEEQTQRERICFSDDLEKTKFEPKPEQVIKVQNLLLNFLQVKPKLIGKVKELSQKLARPSLEVKKFLFTEIESQISEIEKSKKSLRSGENYQPKADQLFGVFEVFQKNLFTEIEAKDFADSFAQMLTYSLFLAKLNASPDQKIGFENIKNLIPDSFHLIKELTKFFDLLTTEKYSKIKWAVDNIFSVVNNIDLAAISEDLNFRTKTTSEKDPYIYFYEDFLSAFDQELRVDRGVYYTPPAIVEFIVSSVDQILQKEFLLTEGLADKKVKCLDFACGTGTFLLEIFKNILSKPQFDKKSFAFENILQNHLLKNIFGFELLISAYAIAHLKLSQFLKEQGFDLKKLSQNRIQIYLTNTLEDKSEEQKQTAMDYLNAAISLEGREATKIKNDSEIIAILGNPPYNVRSKNPSKDKKGNLTAIGKLLEDYKPEDETKINIDDDYIKFIRFAHAKISKNGKGIVGIITNNSFLNGITHRKMRSLLLKDFSSIYILNLHGNSNIGETTPEGEKDENVFAIKQGTCISIFVKNPNFKGDCQVFYRDFWGKKEEKLKNILETNLWQNFTEIDWQEFNQQFRKTRWGKKEDLLEEKTSLQSKANKKVKKLDEKKSSKTKRAGFVDDLSFFTPIKDLKPITEYGEAWGIHEIFREFGSCVKTDRDELLIDFDEKDLTKKLEIAFEQKFEADFVKKYNITNSSGYKFADKLIQQKFEADRIVAINYRPFDARKIYYKVGFTSRPAFEVMQHFFGEENLGLVFMRTIIGGDFNQIMISKVMIDLNFYGFQTYTAPLYLKTSSDQQSQAQNPNTTFDLFDQKNNEIKDSSAAKIENFTGEFRNFIDQKYQQKFSPEQILGYIYAVLHSSNYRTKYLEFLKIDFPRVPFVCEVEVFKKLSDLGKELIEVHLLNKKLTSKIGEAKTADNKFDYLCQKPVFVAEKSQLFFNKTSYFENVSAEIWNFKIGGYQVLDKFLKEREDRNLNFDEIKHLTNIIKSLEFTISQMAKIAKIF
ncbi:MAG: type ISP restriction/modification enzyme [Rickettsiales bacterium]|nr:type ISP restriction/modification enzyme [Rickettsiales bacterium]